MKKVILMISALILSVMITACSTSNKADNKSPKIQKTPQGIVVSTSAVKGEKYKLQACSDLKKINWKDIGSPVTATSETVEITDTDKSSHQKFYRIMKVK